MLLCGGLGDDELIQRLTSLLLLLTSRALLNNSELDAMDKICILLCVNLSEYRSDLISKGEGRRIKLQQALYLLRYRIEADV